MWSFRHSSIAKSPPEMVTSEAWRYGKTDMAIVEVIEAAG